VRKASPFNVRRDGGESKDGLAPITPELTYLGRRCGRLFGLDLFGVDCIETEEGVMVIENQRLSQTTPTCPTRMSGWPITLREGRRDEDRRNHEARKGP